MRKLLQNNICLIKYRSVMGTVSYLTATLNSYVIEASLSEPVKSSRPAVKGNITVWSPDRNQWRSLKRDSILSCQGLVPVIPEVKQTLEIVVDSLVDMVSALNDRLD